MKRRLTIAFAMLLTLLVCVPSVSQELHFGVIGGLNLTSLRGTDNSGMRLGFNLGATSRYRFDEQQSLSVNLQFTQFGQQYSGWSQDSKIKYYTKSTFFYLWLPITYQYYFTNILGIEAGPAFGLNLGGNHKEKVGSQKWDKTTYSGSELNKFDASLVVGVFTTDLISRDNDDLFVSLRGFLGLSDIVKADGNNKNIGVMISVGYMIKTYQL